MTSGSMTFGVCRNPRRGRPCITLPNTTSPGASFIGRSGQFFHLVSYTSMEICKSCCGQSNRPGHRGAAFVSSDPFVHRISGLRHHQKPIKGVI